ncbi:MAG: type II toxin-antitoxin system HicA family toxin [Desulfobulbus sp.]|jgi:predicted RNA binding protein YcfA (HicA-like mRNA interferase family)
MNSRQVIKILQAHGWKIVRTKGSHHLLSNGAKTVPVPVHAGRDIGIGLLRKIEHQTGVKLS